METETRPVLTKLENESQMISISYRIEMVSLFFCDLKENKIPFRERKKIFSESDIEINPSFQKALWKATLRYIRGKIPPSPPKKGKRKFKKHRGKQTHSRK